MRLLGSSGLLFLASTWNLFLKIVPLILPPASWFDGSPGGHVCFGRLVVQVVLVLLQNRCGEHGVRLFHCLGIDSDRRRSR